MLGYDSPPQYDEPEYDYDVIDYDSNDRGESTDELLHRLLKEHEVRLTYKLMREENGGDNLISLHEGDSIGQDLLGAVANEEKAKDKRTKEGQNQHGILKDKKDLESWLHQADPSLTVRELPTQPQISFRKNSHFNTTKNGAGSDKNENPNDLLSPGIRGMKEEVMDRPALENNSRFIPPSPFSKLPMTG